MNLSLEAKNITKTYFLKYPNILLPVFENEFEIYYGNNELNKGYPILHESLYIYSNLKQNVSEFHKYMFNNSFSVGHVGSSLKIRYESDMKENKGPQIIYQNYILEKIDPDWITEIKKLAVLL
mgnify:CR=1 FL=1